MQTEFLSKPENRTALEDIVDDAAQDFVDQPKSRIVFNRLKDSTVQVALPFVLAASAGLVYGGPQGAIDASKQVLFSIGPYVAVYEGWKAAEYFSQPLYSFGYVSYMFKKSIESMLYGLEHKLNLVLSSVGGIVVRTGMYAGVAYLVQISTGVDMNPLLMAGIGFVTGSYDAINMYWSGKKIKTKIESRALKNSTAAPEYSNHINNSNNSNNTPSNPSAS